MNKEGGPTMTIAGIVAEYNPIHSGHAYHIEQTRRMGATHVVACMSGNFVQRGEPALLDKFSRAQAAVAAGVDLVLELPVAYALAPAEQFAFGAVGILHGLGCVDWISFGSECGNMAALEKALEVFALPQVQSRVAAFMREGMSYPAACARAVSSDHFDVSNIIAHPNNTLGIEYMRQLRRLNSPIRPVTVCRQGAAHDGYAQNAEEDTHLSASQLRREIHHGNWGIVSFIPQTACGIVENCFAEGKYLDPSRLEVAVLSRLKGLGPSDYLMTAEVSEGLENKLAAAARSAISLEELYARVKSKRYTLSRIRRIVMNRFLRIPGGLQKQPPLYGRVLAFNDRGQEILRQAKKRTSLCLSTSPVRIGQQLPAAKDMLQLEARAGDLYALCLHKPQPGGQEYTAQIKKQ